MPPSPIYNWAVILVSVSDILKNAFLIRQRSVIRQQLDKSRFRDSLRTVEKAPLEAQAYSRDSAVVNVTSPEVIPANTSTTVPSTFTPENIPSAASKPNDISILGSGENEGNVSQTKVWTYSFSLKSFGKANDLLRHLGIAVSKSYYIKKRKVRQGEGFSTDGIRK